MKAWTDGLWHTSKNFREAIQRTKPKCKHTEIALVAIGICKCGSTAPNIYISKNPRLARNFSTGGAKHETQTYEKWTDPKLTFHFLLLSCFLWNWVAWHLHRDRAVATQHAKCRSFSTSCAPKDKDYCVLHSIHKRFTHHRFPPPIAIVNRILSIIPETSCCLLESLHNIRQMMTSLIWYNAADWSAGGKRSIQSFMPAGDSANTPALIGREMTNCSNGGFPRLRHNWRGLSLSTL